MLALSFTSSPMSVNVRNIDESCALCGKNVLHNGLPEELGTAWNPGLPKLNEVASHIPRRTQAYFRPHFSHQSEETENISRIQIMPELQSGLQPQGISFCPRRNDGLVFHMLVLSTLRAVNEGVVAGSDHSAATTKWRNNFRTIQEILLERNCESGSGQDESLMTYDGIFDWFDLFLPNCVYYISLRCFAVFSACLAFGMVT